jgi:putative membrane protein
MFGTRAGITIDLAFLATLLAPLVVLASIRLVRSGRQDAHRRVQIALLAVCVAAVLALEVRIRLAGGSGAFLAQSSIDQPALLRLVLGLHIVGAVATYALWGWLAVASSRRHGDSLPGSFSRRHRRLGRLVFRGLCFTALSAAAVYALIFTV